LKRNKIITYIALIVALTVGLTMLPLQFVSAGPENGNGCTITINDVGFQASTDGATWWDMPGDDFVYKLCVDGDPNTDYLIRFADDPPLSSTLLDCEYFGLKLYNSTRSVAELHAYYDARTMPTAYRDYLKDAANYSVYPCQSHPFAYIKGSNQSLVDAAKHDLVPYDTHMTIPGDYPTGTYTVKGTVTDGFGCYADITYKLIISRCLPSSKAAQPEPEPMWVRGDRDMVCYKIEVNDNGCFEFVFWWEYKDNNWVKIYDKDGNEVFSIDMPYGKASFEACLNDGTYTVKTFHTDMSTPLQEFTISKP
jgi:hypothetical protein